MESVPRREEILDADSAFFRALLTQDPGSLASLLTPDFLIVDVQAGNVTNRADFLASVGSGLVSFDSIETDRTQAIVRQYATTAVVIGQTEMRFRLPDGTSFTGRSRYTHVFANLHGTWQLASAQGTAVPGPG